MRMQQFGAHAMNKTIDYTCPQRLQIVSFLAKAEKNGSVILCKKQTEAVNAGAAGQRTFVRRYN